MKKITISTMLLAFATASFGQKDTTATPVLMQTDYLQKSKNQKTAAWIFLGTGVALFAGGLIAHYNNVNSDDFDKSIEASVGLDDATGVAMLGLLVGGGSIPFFILSSKNKK